MTHTPITDGLLEKDILDVINAKFMKPDAITYECYIHTEKLDFRIDLLISVEVLRDYVNNVADFIIVNFLFPMGDYVLDIIPFSDNLEMTIKFIYYGKKVSNRYKLVLLNFTGGVANSKYDGMSREAMNDIEKANVEVQCLDRVVEYLRTSYVETILSYETVENAMKSVFMEAISELSVEGQPMPINISVVPTDNPKQYRHIQIPFTTNVLDVPSFLQNKEYGVYNTDIGTYFQTYGVTTYKPIDGIFVYNLLDNKRYDTDERKLMILSSNTTKYEFMENTFKIDGTIVKVVASNVKNFDDGEKAVIDSGNSIISIDPSALIQGNKQTKDNSVVTDPSLHMSGNKSYGKRDGVNKAIISDMGTNSFKDRSAMLFKQRKLFQFEWRFCNPDLIFPGMAVGYLYKSKKYGIVCLKGVVSSVYVKYDVTTKTTTALINAFLESPTSYIYEKQKNDNKGQNYGF